MLKLKLQYFGHLMWRANSWEKTLMLGKTEGEVGDDRGWDGWMASLTQWTWIWTHSGRWWRAGKPGVLQSMGARKESHDWVTEQFRKSILLPMIMCCPNPKSSKWNRICIRTRVLQETEPTFRLNRRRRSGEQGGPASLAGKLVTVDSKVRTLPLGLPW